MHDDLWLPKGSLNKRPTSLNGHLSVRGCNDFFSEELIFAYQQPHHKIDKIALKSSIIVP